jgi:hypothetical protein
VGLHLQKRDTGVFREMAGNRNAGDSAPDHGKVKGLVHTFDQAG